VAFRLTKAELAQKNELEEELEKLTGEIEDGKAQLLEDIQKLCDEFDTKYIEPFNSLLERTRGFVEDIQRERQEEFDDKSDRWQEGERGQSAQDWLNEWEQATGYMDDIPGLAAPEPELEIPDALNALQGLPEEMAE
jgi:hypothetical protein